MVNIVETEESLSPPDEPKKEIYISREARRQAHYREKRLKILMDFGLASDASQEEIRRIHLERKAAIKIARQLGIPTPRGGTPPSLDNLQKMAEANGQDFTALLKRALGFDTRLTRNPVKITIAARYINLDTLKPIIPIIPIPKK